MLRYVKLLIYFYLNTARKTKGWPTPVSKKWHLNADVQACRHLIVLLPETCLQCWS